MLADAVDLIKTIKKMAVDANEAGKPVNICFGTVLSASPLRISVEQKMELGKAQLVLTRGVTEHKTKITGGDFGTIEITVHDGLAVGDLVVLARQQGGQKYIVLDKVAK